jgi:NAD(P)-dependent dehydrogenase (short-subunit alcohol dehydrogenase family)
VAYIADAASVTRELQLLAGCRGLDRCAERPGRGRRLLRADPLLASTRRRSSARWRRPPNVDLLINNAAIAPIPDSISGPEEGLCRIFETNFFGSLRVANAFAPILVANGGVTMLNILSSAAWVSMQTAYAASKAAFWSATNALRFELEGQGVRVVGLLVGMIDTPMAANLDVPKNSPASVVVHRSSVVSARASASADALQVAIEKCGAVPSDLPSARGCRECRRRGVYESSAFS